MAEYLVMDASGTDINFCRIPVSDIPLIKELLQKHAEIQKIIGHENVSVRVPWDCEFFTTVPFNLNDSGVKILPCIIKMQDGLTESNIQETDTPQLVFDNAGYWFTAFSRYGEGENVNGERIPSDKF